VHRRRSYHGLHDHRGGTVTRCGVVAGEDLTTLLAAAGDANALTPWTSGGTQYHLILRPLVPDEHGC